MLFRTFKSDNSSDSLFLPLGDVLAVSTGILILLILVQSMEPKMATTISRDEQSRTGTFTYDIPSTVEYDGVLTAPIFLYRDFFIVPAANEITGKNTRYNYDRISEYPELKEALRDFIGVAGHLPTYVIVEPTTKDYFIPYFLGNHYGNFVVVDRLDDGCRFAFTEDAKRLMCRSPDQ